MFDAPAGPFKCPVSISTETFSLRLSIFRGLDASIFEFYTNSVLHTKYLIHLHSVKTLRKKIACFAQTCDLHNMHNMRTTCEEVPDNECSLYFNQFKIGVQVLFHRSPCHS